MLSRKIVKITKTEFQTKNGTIHPMMFELEEVPTIKEFQWVDDVLTKSFENELVEDMLSLMCSCGLELDRDLNASYNLRNTVSSTGINAHGDDKVHAKKLAGGRLGSENQTSISA